jgi:hypothetical protein
MFSFAKNKTAVMQNVWLLPAWLWLCLLLGGASQGAMLANAVLQLGGTAAIAVWLWYSGRLNMNGIDPVPMALFFASLLWVAIMFIPLPPAIWQLLPGREFVTQGYRLLGMDLPWLAMALAPDRAVRSLLGLIAPLVAYGLTLHMDKAQSRRMIAGIIAIAALSAVLGLAQQATGPQSLLRFYNPTNRDAPVGFFANTNHFAIFLACTIAFASAWVATVDPRKAPKRKYLAGLAVYVAVLAMVLIIGRSVAGIGFLAIALLASAYIIWGRFSAVRGKWLLLLGTVVAGALAIGAVAAIGTGTVGAKFEDVPNSRRNMTPVTAAAANSLAPVGGGLGSFAPVYAMHQPDRYTSNVWVNHAHNDYAELYLELGIPGLLLIAAFLIWFLRAGYRLWLKRAEPSMLMAQAAWLSIGLLLLHSIVDYPLRTAAMASMFAMAVALINRAERDNR